MVEDSFSNRRLVIQLGVVPLAVDVIADEPAHSGTCEGVAGEMLVGGHARATHGASVCLDQNLAPEFIVVLVRKDRGKRESVDGMA